VTVQILRRKQLESRLGLKSSAIYKHIEDKILPPGIHIGPRAVGWPSNEVDTLIAARVSGKSEVQIRELVAKLVADRQHAA